MSAGDDEVLRASVAACLGGFVRHGSDQEVRQVLMTGPLGASSPVKWTRLGHALTLAAIASYAPERYVAPHQCPAQHVFLSARNQ